MLYQLNDIYLDSDSGVIYQDIALTQSTSVQLEHTPLKLLLCLIENKGSDLSKDAMLEQVWANKVVTEDVLTVAMSQIRKGLGDKAKSPKFVKTIPGVGYRLIAEVNLVEEQQNIPGVGYRLVAK